MDDDDALRASATGILNCLRLLAEEAATLRLDRSLLAIREALETVRAERDDARLGPDLGAPGERPRMLH